MLGAREREIKNLTIDALGGPASYRRARQQTDLIDEAYLEIEARRSSVIVRRLAIFVVMYVAIVGSAIVVSHARTGSWDVVLWVTVGTFNAASAAAYYALHLRRRYALEVLNRLRQSDVVEREENE